MSDLSSAIIHFGSQFTDGSQVINNEPGHVGLGPKQDSRPSPFPGLVWSLDSYYTALGQCHIPAAFISCGLGSQTGSVSDENVVRSPCTCQTTLLELQSVWTLRLPLFCSLSELQRAAYGSTSKLSWQASQVPVSTLPPKALRCPSQSSLSGVSPGQKEHIFGIWKVGASLQEASHFFFKGPDSTFLEAFDKAENTF